MKFQGKGPMTVFCRLTGANGKVRETTAVISPNYEHCFVVKKDAAQIGYPSVTYRPEDWHDAKPDEVVRVITLRGIEMGVIFRIKEISVGPLKAENVEAVVTKTDLPHSVPVSMFLGRSFLKHFKLEVDPAAGTFTLG